MWGNLVLKNNAFFTKEENVCTEIFLEYGTCVCSKTPQSNAFNWFGQEFHVAVLFVTTFMKLLIWLSGNEFSFHAKVTME